MSLKFYTDSHIPDAVAKQLRSHGIDIVRCQEVGLADASDAEHLEYAWLHQRAVITKDRDFPALHALWQENNQKHHGIFFCPYRNEPAIGLIVKFCSFYYDAIDEGLGTLEEDIINQLHYVT